MDPPTVGGPSHITYIQNNPSQTWFPCDYSFCQVGNKHWPLHPICKRRDNSGVGAGVVIQSLRVLHALVEEPGLIPNIHKVAHNYPYVTPEPGHPMPPREPGTQLVYIWTWVQSTHIHKIDKSSRVFF